MTASSISVDGLTIALDRYHGGVRVVDGVSFSVAAGGSLGIVGESGSGKSLTLRAVMALLPAAANVQAGVVELDGKPLSFSGRDARRERRGHMAMVFQDSLSALDPVYTVGNQVAETARQVLGMSRKRSWTRAVELLDLVGIRDPDRRAHAFPHELSGGMRQRAMLAVALAAEPQILLCDEPTTALDVTVQAQVLQLLADLRRRLGLTLVFVSHDLAVVRAVCEELVVLYAGRVVETGPTEQVLSAPLHAYTRGLLEATLDLDQTDDALHPIPGSIPEPGRLPAGCAFHPRCGFATEVCAAAVPDLVGVAPLRQSACIHWDELVVP